MVNTPRRFSFATRFSVMLALCLAVVMLFCMSTGAAISDDKKESFYNNALMSLESWLEAPGEQGTDELDGFATVFDELGRYEQSQFFCKYYIPLLKGAVEEDFADFLFNYRIERLEEEEQFQAYLEEFGSSAIKTPKELVAYAKGRKAQAEGAEDLAVDYYKQCGGYYDSVERLDAIYMARYQSFYNKGMAAFQGGDMVGAYLYFKQAGGYDESNELMEHIEGIIGHAPEPGEVWPTPVPDPTAGMSDEEIQHMMGHIEAVQPGWPATCTEGGMTDGVYCSFCGEVLAPQTPLDPLGHDWDEGTVIEEATVFKEGLRRYNCRRCGITRDENFRIEIYIGTTGWVHNADETWAYGDANGYAVLGPREIDGVLYCFDEQGIMITGWAKVGGKYFCANEEGELYHNGWETVNDVYYYFYPTGELATGWLLDQGIYYYLEESEGSEGKLYNRGWLEYEGDWYYLEENGAMKTGWMAEGDKWYFFKPSGAMAVGWFRDYFAEDKLPQESWHEIWYRADEHGVMMTGWFRDKDAEEKLPPALKKELWYYLDEETGVMVTGTVRINKKWEMFDDSGVWLKTVK